VYHRETGINMEPTLASRSGAWASGAGWRWFTWLVGPILTALLWAICLTPSDRAFGAAAWTDPVIIFSTTDGDAAGPILIADPEGTVHLLFEYSPAVAGTRAAAMGTGSQATYPSVLMYARFQAGSWSAPIDALVSSDGSAARQATAALDARGFLHVIWKGGTKGELEYSRAHVSQIVTGSRAWTRPVQLSSGGLTPGGFGAPAAIAAAPDGTLHVVYTLLDGSLLYQRSDNGGDYWSTPVTLAQAQTTASLPDLPRIAVSADGRILVTWTEYQSPGGWPPTGVFEITSRGRGQTWTDPTRFIGPKYGQVTMLPTASNIVHRVLNSVAQIGEVRHQWSHDDGQTWTQAVNILPPALHGGFTGYPALAVDSAGTLHLATAVGKTADTDTDGSVYHLAWHEGRWTDPVLLSRGAVGKKQVDAPTIAVSEGNRLHVAYEDDHQRIWYTSRLLDTPTVQARSVLLSSPTVVPTLTSGAQPPAESTTASPLVLRPDDLQSSLHPTAPLLAGVIPTVVLAAVLVLRARRFS